MNQDKEADLDGTRLDANDPPADLPWWNDQLQESIVALAYAGYVEPENIPEADPLFDRTKEGPPVDVESLRDLLDYFISQGWIDYETEGAATRKLLEQIRTRTVPADLLFYLGKLAQLDRSLQKAFGYYVEEILEQVRARTVPEHLKPHLRLLATFNPQLKEAVKQYKDEIANVAWRRAQWKLALATCVWVIVLGVMAYGVYWWLFTPASTPACAAKETRDALFSIAVKVGVNARMSNFGTKETSSFIFHNEREIGYDEETGNRACTASVFENGADSGEKIGFVIERDPEKRDGFRLQMMPVEFLMARYTGSALNKKLGAPVGRTAMQKAVAAGLNEMDEAFKGRNPALYSMMRRTGRQGPANYAESVQGVLPSADCRALDADRYACPVQIEYQDRLLGAIGQKSWMLLQTELVFERDGKDWKVAEGFEKTFLEATIKGRIGTIRSQAGE